MREPIALHRTRRPAGFRLAAAAAAVALCAFASPAGAEIFHIAMVDGHVFDTRYQPEEASWDPDLVLLLTDAGNWIAVPKAEITGITTETESKGFGRVINTTTVLLGWAANDAPLPEDEARFAAVERLQQFYEQQQAASDYTVDQFVDPSDAGRGGGGLPAYGAGAPQDSTFFGNLGAVTGAPAGVTLTPTPAPPPVAAPSASTPPDVGEPIQ